jgi:uncharacterized protein (DUF849 family)
MEKLIITAALTGNITLPTQTPYLPLTPQQIAEDAERCANAGAASVHVHGRDPQTGKPTTDPAVYRDIATLIKARSNVIVCVTTGGTMEMTAAERIRVVPALKPELATFNMGSINFSIHPIADRYKDSDYKYPWEKDFAAGTIDFIFRNTFGDIEHFCKTMTESNTKPEHEAYDVGHLYNIQYCIRKKLLKFPIWLADRLFGSENYKWSVIGAGYPAEFNLATLAIMMGGHVRVGLEDNIYVSKGVLAKSNAELVEKVVRIARELDREIATPDEARQILGLKGKDKVGY